MSVAAVVPVKDLSAAKRRLAPVLGDEERQGFVLAMLEDVLAAFAAATRIERVFVVAHDPTVAEVARARNVEVIAEEVNRGYDAAVTTAMRHPQIAEMAAALVIPADVPLVDAAEIDTLAGPLTPPAVRLASDRESDGSNGLLLAPPGLMATRYGPGSAARHREAAAAAGAAFEALDLAGLAFDIDTPQDLRDFCARASATQSRAFLEQNNILARLLGGED